MSQYATQIAEKSNANMKAKGIRRTKNVKAAIALWASLGAEVTDIERTANGVVPTVEFVDESEYWTPEDFEEFRAETGESWEEFYGTPEGEPRW